MEAVLNVKNIAYCKVKIEDAVMPPSYNLINHITMQEGFGIAVPTLQINFMDATGTLQNDLNLVQGSKCEILISRDIDIDRPVSRVFSLWGLERYTDSEGPALKALFILDVPKWSAGVYCENFRTTSDDAIGRMAASAGLIYNGAGGTNDSMNWLNINTTRSSFSEDIAIRGYQNSSSCMARILTLDKELRYKNMFKEIKSGEIATLLLNKEPTGPNPIVMKETTDGSISGVFAHWMNYGQSQHEHSLDNNGQLITDRLLAPVVGDAFPINERIKSQIAKLGARITYTGWDPGTLPKPQSNLHNKYERAFYQNLRALGLWGERIRTLTPFVSALQTFDCVNYLQRDPDGVSFSDSRSRNGKYLVAGKTIRIKNGHNYSEILDLIRPYVNAAGSAQTTAPANATTQLPANAGRFDLAAERQKELQSAIQTPENINVPNPTQKPIVERSTELMNSLSEFDKVNPKFPSEPLGSPGSISVVSPTSQAQQSVIDNLQSVMSDGNVVSNNIRQSLNGLDTSVLKTVKRVSSSAITSSANETISALATASETMDFPDVSSSILNNSLTSVTVEKPTLDRFSDTLESITDSRFTSVLTSPTALTNNLVEGEWVGDIQKGGLFTQDFLENGIDVPSDWLSIEAIDATKQLSNLGGNFILPSTGFGIGGGDVAINPAKSASFLLDLVDSSKDPSRLIKDFGAKGYEAMFGDVSPLDAIDRLSELGSAASRVAEVFGVDEVLAGTGIGNIFGQASGSVGSIVDSASDVFGTATDVFGNVIETPVNVINDLSKEIAIDVKDTLLKSPIAPLINTVSGVVKDITDSELAQTAMNIASGAIEGPLSEVKDAMGNVLDPVSIATSVFLDENPLATIKSDAPSGATFFKREVSPAVDNALAQTFDFQFGASGISPMLERIVENKIDGTSSDVTVIDTVRDVVSWATYTRVGANEANKTNSGTEWEFPHTSPMTTMEEADASANGIGDKSYYIR